MDTSFEPFSCILVQWTWCYKRDNIWHMWMNTVQCQQWLQLPKSVFSFHRNQSSAVYLVCGQNEGIFLKPQIGVPSRCVCTSRIGLHTTTPWYTSFSFVLWACGGGHCITVLVRRLRMLDTFLQHTIEVARTSMVARLLGFGVVRGDTCCVQDTPPVGVPDSVTITCPYQVKVWALELPAFGLIFLFAVEDTCGPSTFQV